MQSFHGIPGDRGRSHENLAVMTAALRDLIDAMKTTTTTTAAPADSPVSNAHLQKSVAFGKKMLQEADKAAYRLVWVPTYVPVEKSDL